MSNENSGDILGLSTITRYFFTLMVFQQNPVQPSQQASRIFIFCRGLPPSSQHDTFTRAVEGYVCVYFNTLTGDLYVCPGFHGHAILDTLCKDGERRNIYVAPFCTACNFINCALYYIVFAITYF